MSTSQLNQSALQGKNRLEIKSTLNPNVKLGQQAKKVIHGHLIITWCNDDD